MAEITAAAVMKLRDRTGMQMMKCKAALVEADGDMDKAVELLRKQNKEAQDKAASRETAEGRIAAFIDSDKKVGGLIELQCESAPTAKSELVVTLANDLARQVALRGAANPAVLLAQPFVDASSKTVNERIGEVVGLVRENMKPARLARLEGLLGSYIHHDGSVGVLLAVEGASADPQVLRDVCMHIAAKDPLFGRREDVPADRIAKEKEIALAQMDADPKNKNKPAQILDKIAEGKLKTWFGENVLLEQPFVKDDSKTIGDLLKSAGVKLSAFVRFRVGKKQVELFMFEFAWRITDPRWSLLPDSLLSRIKPLSARKSHELLEESPGRDPAGRPFDPSRYHATGQVSLAGEGDSEKERVKKWLRELPVAADQEVFLCWQVGDGIAAVTDWATFIAVWDDLWYPFDRLCVFDETRRWAVLLGPEEQADFIERNAASPTAAGQS